MATLRIEPAVAEGVVGQVLQLSVEILDRNGRVLEGRPVAWASSGPSIASVDTTGAVTTHAPGTALITATSEGRIGSAMVTVRDPCDPAGARTIEVGGTTAGNLSAGDCQTGNFRYDLYRFTMAAAGTVQIDLRSTAFDAFLYLLAGVAALDLDDDSGGGTNARIVRSLSAGTYYIVVTSFWNNGTGPYTLTLAASASPGMSADGGRSATAHKAEREVMRFPWLR